MSISAREQQTLDSIEARLAGSDPKLASLLGIFGRLMSSEEMPVHEKIRALRRAAHRPRRRRRHPRRNRVRLNVPRLRLGLGSGRVALLLWLVVAVVLIAVGVIATRGGSGGACTKAWGVTCAWRTPTQSAWLGSGS